MSVSLWAYYPDVCDGDFCPQDCDNCYKKDDAVAAAADEDEPNDDSVLDADRWDIEVGYDPYTGRYEDYL